MTDLNDMLTFDGGEIKALGNGKIGGMGVLFTSAEDPDTMREFFLAETDFDLDDKKSIRLLWDHNRDKKLKGQLARARFQIIPEGIQVSSELDLSKREHAAIYNAVQKGEIGFSTGSSSHLVDREPVGKSIWLRAWPISEISLTKRPVEPRARAMALKAMETSDIEDVIKSFEQIISKPIEELFTLAGTPAIARFCEAVAPNSFKSGNQRSEAAADAVKEFITIGQIIGEAFFTDHTRLVRRGEHRFIKSGREIDAATLEQTQTQIKEIEQVQTAFESVKARLNGILNASKVSQAEQRVMDEKARFELWNFCRITGTVPEELEHV